MEGSITRQFSVAIVIILSLTVSKLDMVQGASAPLVSQRLVEKARSAGQVRVIVELDISATAQSTIDSDLIRSMRRAEIAQARGSVRGSLLGTKHSVVREYQELPFITLEVGIDGVQTLGSLHGLVARVVEDGLNRPFLGESIPVVQADQVWAGAFGGTPFTGAGTVIVILDTGVDKNHPFLAGKVVEEACFSSNVSVFGATSVCPGGAHSSFASGSGMPCSVGGCEHGTHVAGIAAGNGSSFSGVAKGASMMAVQVFSRFDDPPFCGSTDPCIAAFDSDVLAGLDHVHTRRSARNFASVNISLGGNTSSSHCDGDIRKSAIDLLRSAGIPTIVASGNNGATNAIAAPACISSAISVGSTGDAGAALDVVSGFSNSASILSMLAPGSLINSSLTPGTGFVNFQGTSMAAPHVAGAFALLKEARQGLTVSQMLSALQNTGLPVVDVRNQITKQRMRILDALFVLPLSGTLQFGASSYSVNEADGSAQITITRTGGAGGDVGVTFSTSNGTANAGPDYSAVKQTVSFGNAEINKTVNVSIINDTLSETTETVDLALSNPTGGAILGAPSKAVLSIVDAVPRLSGTLQFSASSYTVNEAGGSAQIAITRTGGADGAVGVTFATSNGTASAGSDYTAVTQTVSFADTETSKTISVPIVNDSSFESTETVNLALSTPSGGAILGAPSKAVLSITDNDPRLSGTLQFSASSYTVNEAGGSAQIAITRTGGADGAVGVTFATSNGTASAGSDYTAVTQTVSFADTEISKTISVPILNDSSFESTETVNLALGTPSGGAILGALSKAVLSITDNDPRLSGTLRFSASSYTVNEAGGSAQIAITRTGGADGAVGVTFATSNGTASAGSDYTAVTQTVSFADTETSKTISVPILNDSSFESTETVNLALGTPSGGAILGALSKAVLSITDNDPRLSGTLQFSASSYTVNEAGGSAQIAITRTGGADGAVGVTFATSNGTASAGSDYTAVTQTVSFGNGEISKTVNVPIMNDAISETIEGVNLTLGNPTGGAVLGALNKAVLSITDDDDGIPPNSIADLTFGPSAQSSIDLLWTAPGDDGNNGTATAYDLRFSSAPLDAGNWGTATQVQGEPKPALAGSLQNMTVGNLPCNTTYFFGILTSDEGGNTSGHSNVARGKTAACNKLVLSSKTLPTGETGVAYNAAINVTGIPNTAGPFKIQIDATTLPPGLTHDGAETFKGIPTEAKSFAIAGVITDAVGSVLKTKLKVKVAKPVTITTAELRPGKANKPYTATPKAKHGVKAYVWTASLNSALPPNWTFVSEPVKGKISVLATGPGSVDLTFQVRDAAGGTDTQALTLTFN